MPRKPRMYLPGVPCHVIQRGNNQQACFFTEQGYHFYLECLTDACHRYGVSVAAYVLMTNHVHLLMTPEEKDGISRVMQSLGRRYVQYVNKACRRSGTLWEGRHKASLIDAEDYLLRCYRYIEFNPVAAGMVEHPADYPWSSYRHNAPTLVSDLPIGAMANRSLAEVIFGLRPPFRPRARAEASPARVRSEMRSRSPMLSVMSNASAYP